MSDKTYAITRLFRDSSRRDVIETGLTLEQAQAHCNDPETSSSTATSEEAQELTAAAGPWFDSYDREELDDDELQERADDDRRLREGLDAVNKLLGI